MKPATIKWIDRYIGQSLCLLLTLWDKIVPRSKIKDEFHVVLFIKLIEQGASVLAYSALRKAIQEKGKENVYFLVFKENRPILDQMDILAPQNIIEINNAGLLTFLLSFFKAIYQLRRSGIDAAVDMEFFSRASAIIAYLTGARKRVGLHSFTSEHPYRGQLINYRVHYNPYVHVSAYYLMLYEALKEKQTKDPLLKKAIAEYKTELPQINIAEEKVIRLRKKLGLEEHKGKVLLFNPNASDMLPLRKWETSNFESLAKLVLEANPNAVIVFTGVEQEKSKIDQMMQTISSDKVINAAGQTSLTELMALYQLSDLVLTNDSGPGHFASMFSTQVIVLFGPETPQLFAPRGEHIHVIYKKLACSPCVNVFNHRFSPCTDNVCMKTITCDEVFIKIKELLK